MTEPQRPALSREECAAELHRLAAGVEQGYYGDVEFVQINRVDGTSILQSRVTVSPASIHHQFAEDPGDGYEDDDSEPITHGVGDIVERAAFGDEPIEGDGYPLNQL